MHDNEENKNDAMEEAFELEEELEIEEIEEQDLPNVAGLDIES